MGEAGFCGVSSISCSSESPLSGEAAFYCCHLPEAAWAVGRCRAEGWDMASGGCALSLCPLDGEKHTMSWGTAVRLLPRSSWLPVTSALPAPPVGGTGRAASRTALASRSRRGGGDLLPGMPVVLGMKREGCSSTAPGGQEQVGVLPSGGSPAFFGLSGWT